MFQIDPILSFGENRDYTNRNHAKEVPESEGNK